MASRYLRDQLADLKQQDRYRTEKTKVREKWARSGTSIGISAMTMKVNLSFRGKWHPSWKKVRNSRRAWPRVKKRPLLLNIGGEELQKAAVSFKAGTSNIESTSPRHVGLLSRDLLSAWAELLCVCELFGVFPQSLGCLAVRLLTK